MTRSPEKDALLDRISAYVDGALPADEAAAFEADMARDPEIAAELDAVLSLEAELNGAFDELLNEPVPAHLVAAATVTSAPSVANTDAAPRFWGRQIAAALGLLAIGVGAGYLVGDMSAGQIQREYIIVNEAPGWKAQVADYHRVYATQTRHLVEVPASEKDHIEKWLSKATGVSVSVPDLSDAGYEFQGARLLVANGKPVSQLLYTDADGGVIALCGIAGGGDTTGTDTQIFEDDLKIVSWKNATTDFVLVGPKAADLAPLAETLSLRL